MFDNGCSRDVTAPKRRKAIAVLVNNPCVYDSRVIKGAEELAQRGYRVAVFAVEKDGAPAFSERSRVKYYRMPRKVNPPQKQLVNTGGLFDEVVEQPLGTRLRLLTLDLYGLALLFGLLLWPLGASRSSWAFRTAAAENEVLSEFARHQGSSIGMVQFMVSAIKASHQNRSVGMNLGQRMAAIAALDMSFRQKFVMHMIELLIVARAGFRHVIILLSRLRNGARGIFTNVVRRAWSMPKRIAGLIGWQRRGVAARPMTVPVFQESANGPIGTMEQSVISVTHRYSLPVEAFRPDLIHSHDIDCLPAAAGLSERLGCPFIYDVHELETDRPDRADPHYKAFAKRLEHKHIKQAAAVVTVSDDLAEELTKLYDVQPLVMYNTPRFGLNDYVGGSIRADLKLSRDIPLAVYTGVLATGRGLERFITTMKYVDGIHFAMVGNITPKPLETIRKLGRDLGILDRLHFVDPVPFDAVSAYISSADFGVIPALAWTENQRVGLPNKLFEMVFAGLPILIADIPQRRRVLEMYGEGFFFPNEETADLKPYVHEILQKVRDPGFRRGCREKGARALASIGWRKQMETLFELYERLLSDKQAAALADGLHAEQASRPLGMQ